MQYAGDAGIQGVLFYAGIQGIELLYRVLILVMYAAGGCVSAIMVWVAGQARFPAPGRGRH